jgi:hypothetical protein
VDIILQTNTENPSMAFRGLVRFDDGSGYRTKLAIRSGWISADYNFCFQPSSLLSFLADLEQIDRTLTGVARLKPVYEEQFVEFQGIGRGRIRVRGDLIGHAVPQRVQI